MSNFVECPTKFRASRTPCCREQGTLPQPLEIHWAEIHRLSKFSNLSPLGKAQEK
jgi:hypothetical protein